MAPEQIWGSVSEEEGRIVCYSTSDIPTVIAPIFLKGKLKHRKVEVIHLGRGGTVVGIQET